LPAGRIAGLGCSRDFHRELLSGGVCRYNGGVKGHLNAAWHAAHPVPPRPTRADRIRWHTAHARLCGCRPIPASLVAEIRARGRRTRTRTA